MCNEEKRPNDVAINGSTRRRAHLRPRRISDAAAWAWAVAMAVPGPVAIIARTKSAAVLWPKHATQQGRAREAKREREKDVASNPTRFEGRLVWASVSAATNQCKDFFTINCVIESFRRRRSTQQRRGRKGVRRRVRGWEVAHGNRAQGGANLIKL